MAAACESFFDDLVVSDDENYTSVGGAEMASPRRTIKTEPATPTRASPLAAEVAPHYQPQEKAPDECTIQTCDLKKHGKSPFCVGHRRVVGGMDTTCRAPEGKVNVQENEE